MRTWALLAASVASAAGFSVGLTGCAKSELDLSGYESRSTSEQQAPVLDTPSAPSTLLEAPSGVDQAESAAEPRCVLGEVPGVLTARAVDVILVLDNSPSMDNEQFAVEQRINRDFADVLAQSGVDYRVIILSNHRTDQRFTSSLARSSLCVTAPLSSLLSCPAPFPGKSERFFHYSTLIRSADSLNRVLGTYTAPDAAFDQTENGWSQWLRPGSKKVFLELTDDDSQLPAERFVENLMRLGPEHFGTNPEDPRFVFHSLVGLAAKESEAEAYLPDEPLIEEVCTNSERQVTNAGMVYQELSRLTGGLRLPLCNSSLFGAVFERIANDVYVQAGVACDLPTPNPPVGQELDLDRIGVAFDTVQQGEESLQTVDLGQVRSAEECGADAFYLADNRVQLCPAVCDAVNQAGDDANVQIQFACEPTLVLR